MTEKSRVPRKLSLASAYRRVAAKFRRGDHRSSEDYLRYERNAYDSDLPRLMREEAAGGTNAQPWEQHLGRYLIDLTAPPRK